ncbi:8.6 kDa [Spodoptera frugiperda ascovirus 1a]|uniref:8.6 kDa n=1 Tax=Spodoptera frugiperda ascovirus 1a TaxID=113370 RepID=Q0E541_SFAVA|nr:8.6 kDa [Spodoptera frugiperda ascovirus 1a]CAL44660.1 8.6 kDa [Spodoptera frugiperda ascovirus 1a]
MIKRIPVMEIAKAFKTELINVGIFILLSNATVTDFIASAIKTVKPDYTVAGDRNNYMLYTKASILLVASLALNKVLSN